MNPDKYQQAWQAHSSKTRVTIDADLLLKEVQHKEQTFRAMIFWRDFREVGVALLMIPLWFYLGSRFSSPWTWYLSVPALMWVASFMLVDRMRHKQKPSEPSETVLHCVQQSLTQVEHQIWLLRNVFWWYLLPFAIPIMAFFAHVSWLSSADWLAALGVATLFFVFLLVIDSYVYYVNQRAVRVQLEPRRQELLTLLISLRDETNSADSYDIVQASVSPFAEKPYTTPRRQAMGTVIGLPGLIGVLILVVVLIDPAGRISESSYDGPPQSIGSTGDSLARLITDLRKEKKLAGLAAMVMVDGQVEAAAAQGERKIGSRSPSDSY